MGTGVKSGELAERQGSILPSTFYQQYDRQQWLMHENRHKVNLLTTSRVKKLTLCVFFTRSLPTSITFLCSFSELVRSSTCVLNSSVSFERYSLRDDRRDLQTASSLGISMVPRWPSSPPRPPCHDPKHAALRGKRSTCSRSLAGRQRPALKVAS